MSLQSTDNQPDSSLLTGPTPAPEYMDRAIQQLRLYQETCDEFYVSENPDIFKLQARIFAKGFEVQAKGKPAFVAKPIDHEAVELERQRQASREMVGPGSIFSSVAMNNPDTRQTVWIIRAKEHLQQGKPSLLMLGITGAGKTHAGICYSGMLKGPRRYIKSYELYQLIIGEDKKELEQLKWVPVLMIDEVGIEPLAGYKGEDFKAGFIDLIGCRHERQKTTVITSNLSQTKAEGSTTLTFAERYGGAVWSRLMETAVVLEPEGQVDLRVTT